MRHMAHAYVRTGTGASCVLEAGAGSGLAAGGPCVRVLYQEGLKLAVAL